MKLSAAEKQKILVTLIIVTFSIILYHIFNNIRSFLGWLNIMYQNALSPLVVAFFIAFILNLPMAFIEKQLMKFTKLSQSKRRAISIIGTIVFFLFVVYVMLRFAIPQLTDSVNSLVKNIDLYVATVRNWLTTTFVEYDIQLPQIVIDKITEIFNEIVNFVSRGIGMFAEGVYSWLTGTLSSVMGFIVSFAISLYMLVEKEKIMAAMKRLLFAIANRQISERILWVLEILNRSFSNFFRGQLIEGVILAALAIVTMKIFNFPYAVLIGTIVGFTNIIPMFGAFLGGAIGFVIIFMTSPVQALWFALFVVVLQQIESNIIYPRVVGGAIGLSGFWIFVAVTVGGGLGGLPGILLGIPVFTTLQVILKEFTEKRLNHKEGKII